MSAFSICRTEFLGSVQDGRRNHLKFHRNVASWTMWVWVCSSSSVRFWYRFFLLSGVFFPFYLMFSGRWFDWMRFLFIRSAWRLLQNRIIRFPAGAGRMRCVVVLMGVLICWIWNRKMDSKSPQTTKEEISIQHSTPLLLPQSQPSTPSELRFDRPPPADQDLVHKRRLEFGQFVAREAVLDEELWVSVDPVLHEESFNLRTWELSLFFPFLFKNFGPWISGGVCVFDFVADSSMASGWKSLGESTKWTVNKLHFILSKETLSLAHSLTSQKHSHSFSVYMQKKPKAEKGRFKYSIFYELLDYRWSNLNFRTSGQNF